MDHVTFAQLLGNYGEFIGSVGVVVSLVYLAVQIRANTRTTRANASFQAIHSWGTLPHFRSSGKCFIVRLGPPTSSLAHMLLHLVSVT